jgi:hypothetical protein
MRTVFVILLLLMAAGCGTTRWSDSPRTATEQLLLSDAMDRAVSRLDFNLIAGQSVYLDSSPVRQTIDSPYLISSVRQHLIASDCIIKDKPEEADFVLELRAGAVGTDRHELLFGVPATTLPSATPGGGAQIIPELPLAKRTDQRAVAKIALFVYNRQTGRPVWQSGTIPVESKARDLWVFGAGPFQRGSIHQGTKFAGHSVPLIAAGNSPEGRRDVPVTQEAIFNDPHELMASRPAATTSDAKESNGIGIAPAVPVTPNLPAGPSGTNNGLNGLTIPNPAVPAVNAPSSGITSGFSPHLKTRLPDIPLPWTASQTSQEETKK